MSWDTTKFIILQNASVQPLMGSHNYLFMTCFWILLQVEAMKSLLGDATFVSILTICLS